MVGIVGQHEAHIDAPETCGKQGGTDIGIRHEIGADDPQPLACPPDQIGEGDGTFLELVGRPAAHDQDGVVAKGLQFLGRPVWQALTRSPLPVFPEQQGAA
ncbi:hypothetical protein D3C87_1798610 [compost metagenome]